MFILSLLSYVNAKPTKQQICTKFIPPHFTYPRACLIYKPSNVIETLNSVIIKQDDTNNDWNLHGNSAMVDIIKDLFRI